MITWIKSHKTEIGLALSLAVLACSTACAALGITAGDILPGKVSAAESEPLGFDAEGMSVNETLANVRAARVAEQNRRAAFDAADQAVVATLDPQIQLANRWDLAGQELTGFGAQIVLNSTSGLAVGGVGLGGIGATIFAMLLGRKNEHAAWDESREQTKKDLLTPAPAAALGTASVKTPAPA